MEDYTSDLNKINHYLNYFWIHNPEFINSIEYPILVPEITKLDDIDMEELIRSWFKDEESKPTQ